jgi:hypothetical protein
MFMPSKRTIPVLALVLAACSPASEPSAPIIATSATVNNGVGVELQVNGAGVVDLSAAGAPNMSFQFVAHRKGDGTVNGHFRFSRESPTGLVEFEGDVTCVTVDPNFPGRARIGGIVTANNSTAPGSLTVNHEVGDDAWFRVQDDIGGGTVDASTTLGFKPTLVDTSEQYCALPFTGLPWWNPASIFPLAIGTISVKPQE